MSLTQLDCTRGLTYDKKPSLDSFVELQSTNRPSVPFKHFKVPLRRGQREACPDTPLIIFASSYHRLRTQQSTEQCRTNRQRRVRSETSREQRAIISPSRHSAARTEAAHQQRSERYNQLHPMHPSFLNFEVAFYTAGRQEHKRCSCPSESRYLSRSYCV